MLPYDQLIELLEWDEDYLAYILKKMIFFHIAGQNLMYRIKYRPLTESEKGDSLVKRADKAFKLQEAPETVNLFIYV